MKLSIGICTYERAADLRECLRAIDELGYARAHEVLVVDNSESADARRRNEELTRACAGARYLVSEPPGLSRARNAAIAEASGDVLAFLDDDATCLPGWAEAMADAFADAGVVCAGGPILPRWEAPPPAWLGGELLLSLAVMDRGPEARDLRDDEFFYGANCVFRLDALKAVGAFAEHLGRSRSDLMGDEEIDVQRKLKAHGRARHVPGAKVHHLVHAERCTLPWFLKRYAWQGVSDARSGDEGLLGWLGTLVRPSSVPGADALVSALFGAAPRSTDEVVARLRLVRGLVGALLNDRVPIPGLQEARGAAARARSLEDPEFAAFKRDVPGDTEILFLEFGRSHDYLYGAYGAMRGASFVNPALDPTREPRDCTRFLRDALFFASRAGIRAVFLVTADVLSWPGYEDALDDRPPDVAVYGFLHRTPRDEAWALRLRAVLGKMTGVLVFSEAVKRYLEAQYGATNVAYVPHPPVLLANAAPRVARTWRANAGEGRVSLGMLGEVRPGKGYEFALDAIAAAPLATRAAVKVIMAGCADDDVARRIRDTCVRAGLVADLHLGARGQRGYRSIPDGLFAKALASCDVVLFPFDRDHWNVWSGHFADALVAGSWFLASKDTLIGDLVERNGIGATFEYGSAESFVASLRKLLGDVESGAVSHDGRARLLAEYAAESACRAVQDVLAGRAARERQAGAPERSRSAG